MAGTYFDFANTPIEKDITLKAKWCCGEVTCDNVKHPSLYGLRCRLSQLTGDDVSSVMVGEYAVGEEIPDTYDGVDNPWIVAGISDDKTEMVLIRKFVTNIGENDFAPFTVSFAKSEVSQANTYQKQWLTDSYISKCSDEFKAAPWADGAGWGTLQNARLGVANTGAAVGTGCLSLFASDAVAWTNMATPRASVVATTPDGTAVSYYSNGVVATSTSASVPYTKRVVIKEDGSAEQADDLGYQRPNTGFRPALWVSKANAAFESAAMMALSDSEKTLITTMVE